MTDFKYKVCQKAKEYRIETLCAVMQKGGLAPRMKAFRKRYDNLNKKLTNVEAKLKATQLDVGAKGRQLEEMDKVQAMLEASEKQREAQKEANDAKLEALEAAKDELEEQLQKAQTQTATTVDEAQQKQQVINELQAQVGEQDKSIAALKEVQRGLETKIDNHDRAKTELEANIEKLKEDIAKGEASRTKLVGDQENLITLLQNVNKDYEKMEKQLKKGEKGTVVEEDEGEEDEEMSEPIVVGTEEEEEEKPDRLESLNQQQLLTLLKGSLLDEAKARTGGKKKSQVWNKLKKAGVIALLREYMPEEGYEYGDYLYSLM